MDYFVYKIYNCFKNMIRIQINTAVAFMKYISKEKNGNVEKNTINMEIVKEFIKYLNYLL